MILCPQNVLSQAIATAVPLPKSDPIGEELSSVHITGTEVITPLNLERKTIELDKSSINKFIPPAKIPADQTESKVQEKSKPADRLPPQLMPQNKGKTSKKNKKSNIKPQDKKEEEKTEIPRMKHWKDFLPPTLDDADGQNVIIFTYMTPQSYKGDGASSAQNGTNSGTSDSDGWTQNNNGSGKGPASDNDQKKPRKIGHSSKGGFQNPNYNGGGDSSLPTKNKHLTIFICKHGCPPLPNTKPFYGDIPDHATIIDYNCEAENKFRVIRP